MKNDHFYQKYSKRNKYFVYFNINQKKETNFINKNSFVEFNYKKFKDTKIHIRHHSSDYNYLPNIIDPFKANTIFKNKFLKVFLFFYLYLFS